MTRTVSRTSTRTVRRVRRTASDRLPFIPFGLVPLLGLLLLTLFGLLIFSRGWVQQTTERTAQTALSEIGANWATPKVSGQWVVLEGHPPSQIEATRALDAVRVAKASTLLGSAVPATRVTERFTWPDATSSPAGTEPDATAAATNLEWNFKLADRILRLEGDVPDELTRRHIVQDARLIRGITRVDDLLVVKDAPAAEGYLDIALRGVSTVGKCDSGTATFTDNRFSLLCELPEAGAAAVRAEASAPLPFGQMGAIEILANEAVASCEQTLSTLLASTKIEFGTSSALIDLGSAALLDQIAEAANNCPGSLRIEGHTDNTGRTTYNEALSRRRAEAVRAALVERGLPQSRLVAQGFGSRNPIADNDTDTGKARNRRIEIRVVRASD